jgi:hypothetical protein
MITHDAEVDDRKIVFAFRSFHHFEEHVFHLLGARKELPPVYTRDHMVPRSLGILILDDIMGQKLQLMNKSFSYNRTK